MDAADLWPDALGRLVRREELTPELAEAAMSAVLSGEATPAQIAGFAIGLRAKGETPAELAALVRTMVRFGGRVELDVDGVIDTCGTGGDRAGTVNVSTMAALIAAGGGARVVKHGNRAQSSQCGSADVLEALGVAIELEPEDVARSVAEAGIGFCFAPRFHPALRHAGPVRRELGVGTTFNFLGPLANPARVRRQAVGVSDATMAERIVETLRELGSEHVLVFFGHDGLDELTTTTTSTVWELRDGDVRTYYVDPQDFGITKAAPSALAGGDAPANAAIVHDVLAGKPGPARDIALVNAAAAFVVAGLVPDLGAGVELARAVVDDGRAAATLDAFVTSTAAARARSDA